MVAAITAVPTTAIAAAMAVPAIGKGRRGGKAQHGGKRRGAKQRFKRHGLKPL
jgi:hypothetical protein